MKRSINRWNIKVLHFFVIAILVACGPTEKSEVSLFSQIQTIESIPGNDAYKQSSYVTAGDRVYLVGNQDGTFPDIGWHIDGEMGGLWNHPIKLMDGFSLSIDDWCLENADKFENFPFFNVLHYSKDQVSVKQLQFIPDGEQGLVLLYEISNQSSEKKSMELNFTGSVDLRPTWLAERQQIEDASDSIWSEGSLLYAKDLENDWFVCFGGNGFEPASSSSCDFRHKGQGAKGYLKSTVELAPGQSQTVTLSISGSYTSLTEAKEVQSKLTAKYLELWNSKKVRYEGIEGAAHLITGDARFDRMFNWIKYGTDWLVRDVPEVGRGVSAGIPDYPWWFGTDNSYTLQGMAMIGMHDEMLSTIDLIIQLSRKENNGSGRIVHETSSNGIVFNPGNLNTTPNFINALWKAYQWSGDSKIIDDYYEDIKNGIAWIESQDKDGNGYPDGAGMMEIPGLHSEMVDVVAYQYLSYISAANFARVKGDTEFSSACSEKAEFLRDKLNTDWWVDNFESFADFRSSKEEALHLIKAAIVRADTIDKPWSVEELKATLQQVKQAPEESKTDGYVVHNNWVVNTPMEVGVADSSKAILALNRARNYRNKYGMFVTGIDRDEQQDKAAKWKAFSYVGAVMTLPTGVQAISEANYGRVDASLEYLKMLENSFSYALPGSMYEVSPDFGMIVQAWNVYALAVPVIEKYFGIQPSAWKKEIRITPNLPSSWENVSLENVIIGDNRLTINVEDGKTIKISQTKPGWTIVFESPGNFELNGVPGKSSTIEMTGLENVIVLK